MSLGSKRFTCPVDGCIKHYNSSQALSRHKSIAHDKRKPYVCNVCFKSFGRSDTHTLHMQKHDALQKSFACTVCTPSRTYAFKTGLYAHFRITHAVTPQQCGETETSIIFNNIKN